MSPPATLEEARRLVTRFIEHYNTRRLHSAIGYVTPHDHPEGRQKAIHHARDHKLEGRARDPRRAPASRPTARAGAATLLAHPSPADTRFVTPQTRES